MEFDMTCHTCGIRISSYTHGKVSENLHIIHGPFHGHIAKGRIPSLDGMEFPNHGWHSPHQHTIQD